ncbi:MAG: heme ABC exporter ATP-binding protein CcmA [Candidatus Cloacimonetes bacterium 4572_55]|nr:MAG: heme ABC exporter ATP-binding protein CcmA [Candidatus Cloacimonetes bacterium 4572_55]
MNSLLQAIQAENISKSFGRLVVLRRINLSIAPGEHVALLGRNGAGKTTLLRILTGLIHPTTGTVWIDAMELQKEPEKCRSRIGFISHQTFLYDDLTPIQNLKFYAGLYQVDDAEERITELLKIFGLFHRQSVPVRTFSRGMKQRLTIARAFLHNPAYLFLDEPFTGLDFGAANLLIDQLNRLGDSRHTTILVTHDLEKAYRLSERIIVIEKGKKAFDESTKNISFSELKSHYRKYSEISGNTLN